MSKKQSFLEGALTLTLSTVVVKLIGAFFKIPLANIIGSVGMSYFSTAYDIFTPLYSVVVSGLGIAMSRLIAESVAKNDFMEQTAVLKAARRYFILFGIVSSIILYFLAMPVVRLIGNRAAYFSVIAIIPSIMIGCVSAIYRGYYQGKSDMRPTAISQVIEAVVKLICGLSFAYAIKIWLMNGYRIHKNIFGNTFSCEKQAEIYTSRFTSAAAIVGIALSAFVGAIYAYIYYRKDKTKNVIDCVPSNIQRKARRSLLKIGTPIALSTLVVSLSNFIDLVAIMNALRFAIKKNVDVVYSMYNIPSYILASELPEYLYGSFSGIAHSIAMLVPSFAAALSISIIPAVSSISKSGNSRRVNEIINMTLRITIIVVLPMGLLLFFKSSEILNFLYPLRKNEVEIVTPILRIMGINAILVSVSASINSILQAIGKEKIPLYLMSLGAILKTVLNVYLISKPSINIQGAPYSSLISFLVVTAIGAYVLVRSSGISLDVRGFLVRPILCVLFTFGIASYIYSKISVAEGIGLWIYMLLIAVFYTIFALFLGVINKSDLVNLKFDKKIIKTLEKCFIIR